MQIPMAQRQTNNSFNYLAPTAPKTASSFMAQIAKAQPVRPVAAPVSSPRVDPDQNLDAPPTFVFGNSPKPAGELVTQVTDYDDARIKHDRPFLGGSFS